MDTSTNRMAAERTISVLLAEGTLKEGDEAIVEAVLHMAEVLDDKPDKSQIWKEYNTMLRELWAKRTPAEDTLDEEFAKIVSGP